MYNKNLVFTAACLGMLLFGIVFLSLGSANNMLAARFGLDDIAIGTLTALLPFGILVGSLIFGPIVDRFGFRWMLVAASLMVGISLEGMAYAQTERLIQLFVFLIGLGGGVLNGATNALAADVSEGARGARLSLLGVFFGAGALAMPTTIALLSRHYALDRIVSGIGLLTLVPAIFCLVITFPPPKQRNESVTPARILRMFLDPVFLLACLALAIQSGMEGMSNDWMTRYFKKVTLAGRDSLEWQTQLGLVAVTGSMLVTRLILSVLLQHIGSRMVLLASVIVAASGVIVLSRSESYGASLLAAILIGSGLSAAFPVVLGYVGDRYAKQSGTAFSTIFVVALAGNMAVNKSFGYIAHSRGIEQYATMMLGLLTCSAVLLWMIVRQLDRNTIT